jgi:hypothetical protein
MNNSGELHDSRPQKKWRKVNVWSIKGPYLVALFVLGLFYDSLHWGRAPIAVGIAMIAPVIGYRDFWNEARFWISVLLLGAVQVPLAVAVSPLMERFGFPFMFTFAIFDSVLVVLAISWVCSE